MPHLIDKSYWTPLVGPTAAMFVGVNEGYNVDASVTAPEKAEGHVRGTIFMLKHIYQDVSAYNVKPGLIVYRPEWGCPVGGEAVAYVSTRGPFQNFMTMGEKLRACYKQTTVSVVDYTKHSGVSTASFIGNAAGDIEALGLAWQRIAEKVYEEKGIYVSCGLYKEADGSVVLSAEQNPLYAENSAAWQAVAQEIMEGVEQITGAEIYYSFRQVGFNYLRSSNLPNSRGHIVAVK